jgi:hypothetical protein
MFEGNPHAGAAPIEHSAEHCLQIQGASQRATHTNVSYEANLDPARQG